MGPSSFLELEFRTGMKVSRDQSQLCKGFLNKEGVFFLPPLLAERASEGPTFPLHPASG